jgi:hypothetical protein
VELIHQREDLVLGDTSVPARANSYLWRWSPGLRSGANATGLAGADADVPLAEGVALPPGTDMTEPVRRVIRYVRHMLPGLDPEAESVRLCLATALPGQRDGFQAWQRDGARRSQPLQFAPVIGELIADAVQQRGIPEPLRVRSDAIPSPP